MFASLERLGGVQVAILSLLELAISLALAFVFLGERLAWHQWMGALLVIGGGSMVRWSSQQVNMSAETSFASHEARSRFADSPRYQWAGGCQGGEASTSPRYLQSQPDLSDSPVSVDSVG